MPRHRARLLRFPAVVVFSSLAILSAQAPPNPPVAKKMPKQTTLHGVTLVDDYHWLRDKGSPDVTAYLEAENAYTDAGLKHTAALQETLYNEILGRIKESDQQVPVRRGDYFYYSRTEKGKNYPIFCRKKGSLDAPEEIYLDQNALAEGKKFHALGGLDVSPDGTKVIYLEDLTAFREYTLYVKDIASGKILDSLPKVWNGTAWANDNRTFFYMTADAAKRGDTVWRHVLGTPREKDAKIFHEPDVLFNAGVDRMRSGEYIAIGAGSFTSGEYRVIPTANPTAEPRLIAARRPGIEYSLEHGNGWFYMVTNEDAKNFRIRRAADKPGTLEWTDWAPHSADVFIENFDVFDTFAVVVERRKGLRQLRVVDLADNASHDITFDESAYGVFPSGNAEFKTATFRFSYSSPVTPSTVFDYTPATRQRVVLKQQEIPSGFDKTKYEVRRAMAPARDGVSVPVSILMPKGAPLDGSRPLLLYAYGSYGSTTEPTFSSSVFSLVDRGMIYAIAHIRGGQEMGRQWYDDGKMLKKKNTFFDFVDVAEYWSSRATPGPIVSSPTAAAPAGC